MTPILAAIVLPVWIAWIVFFIVMLGHVFAARALIGRLHRIAMPHRVWVSVVGAAVTLAVALFVVLLIKAGLRGPRLLRGGAWEVAGWWSMHLTIGALAAIAGACENTLMRRRKPAAAQKAQASRVEIITSPTGGKPSGDGLAGWVARLPGNELFEVEFIERTLRLPRLPAEWHGLSVVHLSDLHINGTPDLAFFERVSHLIEESRPDLIALTGDVLDTVSVSPWLDSTLGSLHAPLGRYFVLGNHDIDSNPDATRARLAALGWVNVAGRAVEVEHRGALLRVAGNERPWMGEEPTLPDTRRGDPPREFRLALSHGPDRIAWASRVGADLLLAGHLHGGQVWLPLLGPMKTDRWIAGVYEHAGVVMHVSRGLGEMTPVRWGCRPEVTRLVLEPG